MSPNSPKEAPVSGVPLILARSFTEAHAFAADVLGLEKGRYRVITSPSSISGLRGCDLHLVPGYENRFDRFAMKGALKYTRLNVITHEETPAEVPDESFERGPDAIVITNDEAHTFFADSLQGPSFEDSPQESSNEDIAEETSNEEAVQAEEPAKRTRRRRCSDCGLLIEPDQVEAHAAEHLAGN